MDLQSKYWIIVDFHAIQCLLETAENVMCVGSGGTRGVQKEQPHRGMHFWVGSRASSLIKKLLFFI